LSIGLLQKIRGQQTFIIFTRFVHYENLHKLTQLQKLEVFNTLPKVKRHGRMTSNSPSLIFHQLFKSLFWSLPAYIRSAQSLTIFKSSLKTIFSPWLSIHGELLSFFVLFSTLVAVFKCAIQ